MCFKTTNSMKHYSDDSSRFVVLGEQIPDIIQEIRYYSTYNFVGERIDGYEEPVALLIREAEQALRAASDEFVAMGYRIKVFDAYRPVCAVEHFVRWCEDEQDVRMKEAFYPEENKAEFFEKRYIAKESGHSRGSTVDVTLVKERTGKELDMGSPFDFFGEISRPDSGKVTEEQRRNRKLLRDGMVRNGFEPSESEWWHFTLKNEPYPETYFTFPVAKKVVNGL